MRNQAPAPFKKIRNIPWGYVCATQLAHPLKNKKHPWGHVGATKLALLTCFILMCFFYGQYSDRCFLCMELVFNKLPRGQGEKIRWSSSKGVCMCTFYLPASLSASGFQGAGRQNPRFSQSCAQPTLAVCGSLSLGLLCSFRHVETRVWGFIRDSWSGRICD
jgi:hypothetical protein